MSCQRKTFGEEQHAVYDSYMSHVCFLKARYALRCAIGENAGQCIPSQSAKVNPGRSSQRLEWTSAVALQLHAVLASCREPAVGRFIDSQEALAIDLVREMCLLERDVSSKFVY
jgi:hypothetical protein